VQCASCADEGRGEFARQRPDVLMSDLAMPVEDGFSRRGPPFSSSEGCVRERPHITRSLAQRFPSATV